MIHDDSFSDENVDEFDHSEQIYLDLDSYEFSELQDISSRDKEGIIEETKGIFAAKSDCDTDLRPKAYCSRTKRAFLVDSGAAVSVFPRAAFPDVQADDAVHLRAVNGSLIKTFGKRTLRLQFGRAHFTHTFVLAEIPSAVLGWDMIRKFRLDLRWQGQQCTLKRGQKSIKITLEPVQRELLGLHIAEVSFKDHAQAHKVSDADEFDIPPVYEKMLAKYPGIDTPNFKIPPAHGVVHHIDTGDHPPCRAKLRRLLPGCPKEVKGKEKILEMERLGILKRIQAHETTTWSSALHLAPKPDDGIRATGDFRPLNQKTTLDTHPLPNIRSFQDRLKGARVFSTIDLKAAYFQVPITTESSFKTVTLTNWHNLAEN